MIIIIIYIVKMRWLRYLFRITALKDTWWRTRDLPHLTDFLEHNRFFRHMALMLRS